MPNSPRGAAVVINADDYGLHPAVNQGIVEAHRRGVVTSTSLMACGKAFEDAVARLGHCPALGVGIHLTLVEERPVCPPTQVASLVGADGRMPWSYAYFARRWLAGRIRADEIRRELTAQIERVIAAGIRPTHVDSHQHVHCLPGIWPLVVDLAQRYQIPYLRLPRFDSWRNGARTWSASLLRVGVNALAGWRQRAWPAAALRRADDVQGLSVSGRMTSARLLNMLQALRPGLTEIMVHPGTDTAALRALYHAGPWEGFDWEVELQALTDEAVRERCHNGAVRLTHFGRAIGAA